MSMLLQLGKLPDDEIPDIVCYEKQDTLGGLWNVTWRTGKLQVITALYCKIGNFYEGFTFAKLRGCTVS